MTRRLLLSTLVVFALSALSALSATAHAQDRVLRKLDVGDGRGSVGVTEGTLDEEAVGPAAMFAGDDGKLYVLDQVNGRILSMDPDNPAVPPKTLDLPPGLNPKDMVAIKDQLYVWDGQVHALKPKAAGDQADSGAAAPLEARAVGGGDPVTQSAFAQMGSETTAGDAETIKAVGRSLSGPDSLDTVIRQTVRTRSKIIVNAEILPNKEGNGALIELRPENDPLNVVRINARVTDRIGSIEVLDVDASGGALIFIENVPTDATGRVGIYVARFTAKGRLDRIFDLPLAADQIGSRRFVTISPKGEVLFLKSDDTGVAIVTLGSRVAKRQVIDPAPITLASTSMPDLPRESGYITAVRPNSRMGVIQTGLAFEGLKWQMSPANYGRDPDTQCNGFGGRVRRPWYLSGKVGQEVRGVPYCWGCFGTLQQFARRMQSGMLAGNICTKDNPRRDAAGVDCSAFVSAAWGLQRQYTTLAIPSITQRVADPWQMKPGDAFNKPGSHVMLFVRFTPDRKVEVLEASTGGCNGRVCRNIYPLSALLARGYQPVRYPSLTD